MTDRVTEVWKARYDREYKRRQITEDLAEEITRNLYNEKIAKRELKRANEELEQFTHIAAHDLREPLRRIETVCAFILPVMKERIDPEDRELLDILETSVRRMRILVDDFHSLTNIATLTLSYVTTPIAGIIEKCLDKLEKEIKDTGVKIEIDEHPSLPVYPALMEQLYINLIRNALFYASGPDLLIRFTCTKKSPFVFGVKNTGSRLRPELLKAIFLPFKRFNLSREGSGLGLFICTKIVERHGGKIWAESEGNSVHIKFTLGEHNER